MKPLPALPCAALALAVLPALLSCGGSGASAAASSATGYPFVAPAVGSQRNYTRTIVDNASNTISLTLRETVTALNGDGSYVFTVSDPTNGSYTVDNATYSITPQTVTADSSGRTLSTATAVGGVNIVCTDTPYGSGPAYPASVGETWTTGYTESCTGGAALSYSDAGDIADAESLVVPAGTFATLKLQSTLAWTTPAGVNRTETITRWRDARNGLGVKEIVVESYSVAPSATGYAVTVTTELQSL